MCTCTCRLVLFVVNVIVGLAGFLLMLFGSLMSWGKPIVKEQLTQHIGPMVRGLYGSDIAEKVSHLAEIILRFTAPFGLLIFGFGTAILILCIFGCCGACSSKTHCMKIYTALLIVIAFTEFTLLVFYYANRPVVFHWTNKLLKQSLNKYKSLESDDPYSVLFNVMMSSLNCCGIESGLDFKNATDFTHQWTTKDSKSYIEYPVTCCKMRDDFEILDQSCPSTFNESNSNIGQGCWDELYPHLVYYGNAVAIVGIVVLLFQVLLITMSVITLAMKQF